MERVKVSFSLEEKIGLKNFSNVVVGPAYVEVVCDNTPEARKAAMAEAVAECEEVMASERGKVLAWAESEGIRES